jgi:Na+/H+-dicarboxylate symporter
MKLWLKIILAVFLGVATGLLLRTYHEAIGHTDLLIAGAKLVGDLFIKLLKMVLALLLISSTAVGIADIKDNKTLKDLSQKTLLLFLCTTLIAIGLGFLGAIYFQPGASFSLDSFTLSMGAMNVVPLSPLQLIIDVVPDSIIGAMANNNALQILFFGAFLGLAINQTGEPGQMLLQFLRSLSAVIINLVQMNMKLAPYGIGAMMVWLAGSFGWGIFVALLKVVGIIYLICLIHMGVVYSFLLKQVRYSPLLFYKQFAEVMLFAFSSSSSAATLPVAVSCMVDKIGVPLQITRFIMPLGATVNMNGTAIFHAVVTLFIAQIYGVELHWTQLLLTAGVITLAAVGTAGAPGSGILVLGTVLTTVGLPVESVGIIWGIDRIRDMICTVVNVTGDAVVTIYVSQSQGYQLLPKVSDEAI